MKLREVKIKGFFLTITLNKTCLEAREAVYSLGIYFYDFDLLLQDTTIQTLWLLNFSYIFQEIKISELPKN